MASYTIARDEIAAHDKTLVPNVVDTVMFEADPNEVQIVSDGAAAIYVTVDGSTPTVGGSKTFRLPPVPSVLLLKHPGQGAVQLISEGAPVYGVERA